MIYYAKTHRGHVRPVNEDALYIPEDDRGCFAVIADGMGGHRSGQLASRLVIEAVCEMLSEVAPSELSEELVRNALNYANSRVWQVSQQDPTTRGMGSTATLAAFAEGQAFIANVGDSRAYLFRKGRLTQITKDHSYVQVLIDRGFISKEDALRHPHKNVITRAIGTEADVEADVYTVKLNRGDAILLCSDGLNNIVTDKNILRIMAKDLSAAAENLIEAALKGGGTDNISVVIAAIDGGKA